MPNEWHLLTSRMSERDIHRVLSQVECFSCINLVLLNLIRLTHWEVLICKEAKLFMIVRALSCLIFKSIILNHPYLCVFYVARCNLICYYFALVCTFGRSMGFPTMICFLVLKKSPTIILQHWREWIELKYTNTYNNHLIVGCTSVQ